MPNKNRSSVSMKPVVPLEFEHLEFARPLEVIRTNLNVPRNPSYYGNEGLRIEDDGVDQKHYNTHSVGFVMTVFGCSCALAGSQIVPLLYLTLGTTIALELGAPSLTLWILTALIVAMGALAPFVGPLADMFGRKPVFYVGLIVSIAGAITCAATPTAGGFIVGQCLLGIGAVTQELLAIAVVAEIVPTAKRGLYAALISCTIIPWSPATLYANWMADSSWRWIGCTVAIWNILTLAIIGIFYHPPPRVNALGLSRREMFSQIDFVGGALITMGLVFVLVALNSGGQQYPWQSTYVLSFLISGICLMIGFGFWEKFGARHPLFPRRIIHAPRPFFCIIFVIFAAGINFVPLVVFWPIESISVFGSNHHQTGINTLPITTCILGGVILSALLIGVFKRHVTLLMTFFCVMQTTASACLIVINPHDIRTAWPAIVLASIGVGGVLVPNQVVMTMITPDDLIASVTALTVGLRAQAQVIGLAIFYNRFIYDVTKNALKYVVPAMLSVGVYSPTEITDMVTSLTAVPFDQYAPMIPQLLIPANYELVKEATIQCFSQSFLVPYYITIAFGVPACIAAAFMGDISQYMDDHVAVLL